MPRSIWPWLTRLTLDLAIFAACFAVLTWTDSLLMSAMAVLLIGARQQALGVLAHESVHYLVSERRWLNDLCGQLTFLPIHAELTSYRAFHFLHHATVGTADDPELDLVRFGSFYRQPITLWRLLRHCLYDCCGLGFILYCGFQWDRWRMQPFWATIHLLGIVAIGAWCWDTPYWSIFCTWHLALVTTFWVWLRLQNWSQHQEHGVVTSLVHANWLARLLIVPHNIWYHVEHHADPGVPCGYLPQMRTNPGQSLWQLFVNFAKE